MRPRVRGIMRPHERGHPVNHLRVAAIAFVFSLSFAGSVIAQDVRGMEVCTAEKQMERRTSCLQSNVEFLQRALTKFTRETQEKLAATSRELSAAKAETASLKVALDKVRAEIAELKKAKAPAKPENKPAR